MTGVCGTYLLRLSQASPALARSVERTVSKCRFEPYVMTALRAFGRRWGLAALDALIADLEAAKRAASAPHYSDSR